MTLARIASARSAEGFDLYVEYRGCLISPSVPPEHGQPVARATPEAQCRIGSPGVYFLGSFLPTKKNVKKLVTFSIEEIPLNYFRFFGSFRIYISSEKVPQLIEQINPSLFRGPVNGS